MNKRYFMTDQVTAKERAEFPGKNLLLMSTGLLFSTVIVITASLFYVR